MHSPAGSSTSPRYPIISAPNSGSGLKVNVRLRCGCNCDACRIACTVVLAVRQTEFSCQSSYRPAALRFRVLTGQGLYFLPNPGIVFWWPGRSAAPSRSPFNPSSTERPPPFPHCDLRDLQLRGNLLVCTPRCRRQDNLAPQHQRTCAVDGACTQLFKVALVFRIEANSRGDSWHAQVYQKFPILQITLWTMH